MTVVPLSSEQYPLLLIELLIKLKAKDVMTPELVTAGRSDSLRAVQQLMKANRITGVPIVANKRLFGIVSIDDIINALDGGYIDDDAEKHMSTHMVVFEENMPLSFCISYFQKYRYGRFPVLNRDNELVGIITSRDINTALLVELTRELNKQESQSQSKITTDAEGMHLFKVYHVRRYDFENAGKASTDIRKFLKKCKIKSGLIRRVSVAAYELEMNQVVHSLGGTITCRADATHAEIIAQDTGPGIEDVELSMQEGVTTANAWIQSMGFGAGMGLPNAKRVADEFDISSSPDGTRVRVLFRFNDSEETKTNENQ